MRTTMVLRLDDRDYLAILMALALRAKGGISDTETDEASDIQGVLIAEVCRDWLNGSGAVRPDDDVDGDGEG